MVIIWSRGSPTHNDEKTVHYSEIPITNFDTFANNGYKLPDYKWQILDVIDCIPVKDNQETLKDNYMFDNYEKLIRNRKFTARVRELCTQKTFCTKNSYTKR